MDIVSKTHICRVCKTVKLLEDFSRSAYHKNGYITMCKECGRVKSAAYYHAHKDSMRVKNKQWYAENREYDNARHRHASGKEEAFIFKNKLRGDPSKHKQSLQRKISNRLRTGIVRVLDGKVKATDSFKLLDCTFEEFRAWIERHFEPGMSWDNYGRGSKDWSLDHHFPCRSFDLRDPIQQKQCFHWTNIYPMWHIDNIRKNDTVPAGPRTSEQANYLNETTIR